MHRPTDFQLRRFHENGPPARFDVFFVVTCAQRAFHTDIGDPGGGTLIAPCAAIYRSTVKEIFVENNMWSNFTMLLMGVGSCKWLEFK